MRRKVVCVLLLFAFLSPLPAESPDTVLVEVVDLLKLQDLLRNTMQQQEIAMQRSSELQKITNASGTELSGLRLDFGKLKQELADLRSISEAQRLEINRLLPLLENQDKISQRQSVLLGATLIKNKRLKVTLMVAIPVAAGAGIIAGWALSR